jgi:hypothetical protein
MKKKIIIGALVVCLLVFVAVFAFSQSSANVRWEYTSFDARGTTRSTEAIERANQLGGQGWELISTEDTNGLWIFKRRL